MPWPINPAPTTPTCLISAIPPPLSLGRREPTRRPLQRAPATNGGAALTGLRQLTRQRRPRAGANSSLRGWGSDLQSTPHPLRTTGVCGSMHLHDAQRHTPARTSGVCGAMQVESADAAIARIAAGQYGVVTRAQLAAAGLGRGSIEHRIAAGRLHRIHRRVYLVGHPVPPRFACEMAAVLAAGQGAALSHGTAASMWSLPCDDPNEIHVTVPGRDPGSHPGIRIHRV